MFVLARACMAISGGFCYDAEKKNFSLLPSKYTMSVGRFTVGRTIFVYAMTTV
jgi:hypothetical protein